MSCVQENNFQQPRQSVGIGGSITFERAVFTTEAEPLGWKAQSVLNRTRWSMKIPEALSWNCQSVSVQTSRFH